MMIRTLLLILLCVFSRLIFAQADSILFPSGKFSKVIGYTFNKNGELKGVDHELPIESIIDKKTKQVIKRTDTTEYLLSQTQTHTHTLLAILNDSSTFRKGESGCFVPHHAFVFFDGKNVPVAYIDICFLCEQSYAYPPYKTAQYGGLSEEGTKRLLLFCQELNMPVHKN